MEQIQQYYAITAIRPDAQKVVPVWDLPTDERAKIGKDIVLKKSGQGRFDKKSKKFKQKSRKRGGDDSAQPSSNEFGNRTSSTELITVMFLDNM